MGVPIGNVLGIRSTGIIGPWPCEACGELSQYADVTRKINRVFCKNESCGFTRIIDKGRSVIQESDGTVWRFDTDGNKVQVRRQVDV